MRTVLLLACLTVLASTPAHGQWPSSLPDSVYALSLGFLRLGATLRPGQFHLPYPGDTVSPGPALAGRHAAFEAHPNSANGVLQVEATIDDARAITCLALTYGPDVGLRTLTEGLRSAFGQPRLEWQDHFGSYAIWGDNAITWSVATGSPDPAHGSAVLIVARRNPDLSPEDPKYRSAC